MFYKLSSFRCMNIFMLYIWSSLRCMDIFMLYKLSSLRCMNIFMLYKLSSLRCMDRFMLYKLSSLRCRYVVTPNKLSSLKDCVCAIVANTSLTPCFQNHQSGSCTPPARCGQVWSDAGRMKFTCRPCCTASGNCPCSRWPAMPPGSTRSTTTR